MSASNHGTITKPRTMGAAERDPGRRVLSIDITRGFALICMVLVHFTIYFGNEEAAATWPYFLLNDGLADWGAAVFLMMMGISQVLSAHKHRETNPWLIFKRALLRGSYLFVVGLLMLLVAFGPNEMWSWDILTLMGFATVVLFFCRFLPSWLLLLICVAIAVLSPMARGTMDLTSAWGNNFVPIPWISDYLPGMFVDLADDSTAVWELGKIITGFFLAGYFPVMPWTMFAIIGFLMGRRLVKGRLPGDLPLIFLFGAIMVALGIGGAYMGRHLPASSVVDGFICPLSFYPDSFTMINLQIGMSIIVFSAIFYFYDVRKHDQQKLSPIARVFTRTSRFSLSFYFIHYLLLGWPLIAIYVFTGKYLIENLMGFWPAVICGLAAVLAIELWLVRWEKLKAKFSLEWFLGFLTFALIRPAGPETRHKP